MARRDAERALKLAPDSPDALFALGRAQRDFEPDAAEQTFKKILGRQPDDFRALGNLASIYDYNGRPDEAVAIYERIATADPAHEALTRYTEYLSFFHYARFAEAERCIRRSVAIQPSANSQAGLAMLLLTWKGEADEAARVLATGPTAARNEPRTIWTTAFVDLCRRAPDDTLRTLDRLADDFIQDNWFTGPKAYFAGRAHALAGRTEAARIAWESALAVTDAHLKDTPADVGLHVMRGELLAFLGQPDEALREARAVAELGRGNPRDDRYWFISPALIYAVLGRADDALPLLEKICAPPKGQIVGWPLTPALLRLDPLWDKLRGDPRFQELCAEPAATEPQSVAVPAASQPPVDPDLQRAAHLLESTESIAADITLAEDLVKGVLAAHPTDPAATIMMARVQTYILVRGFDRSEDRFAAAKRFSERALALAPEDPDALASMAVYLYRRGVELPRAQKLLRQAIARRPTEPYYYRMLDNVLSIDPNETDATIIANALETARRFPADALVQYELGRHYRDAGQLAEAEHCYDLAIKLGPVANAIIGRARLKLFVHGDPAGMRQLLDTLPDNYRGTDRAVFSEFTLATATGTPEKGLEALQALPEPWMIDFDYTGPTDLLRGELLLQEGKPELAQIRFAEALAELHRHKVDISRNFSTTWLETWLLMRLGRRDEARARNAVFLPELARPYRIYLGSNWWFNPIVQNLMLGEHARAIQLMHETVGFQLGRTILRNMFGFDPRMAPFRDDPEIKALLAEPASGTKP
jgi:tetratricopeptide (TPR) repeat protein